MEIKIDHSNYKFKEVFPKTLQYEKELIKSCYNCKIVTKIWMNVTIFFINYFKINVIVLRILFSCK